MKPCADCGLTKPLDQFFKSWKAPDGHRTRCKACNQNPVQKPTVVHAFERTPPTEADFAAAREAGMALTLWGILKLDETPSPKEPRRSNSVRTRSRRTRDGGNGPLCDLGLEKHDAETAGTSAAVGGVA